MFERRKIAQWTYSAIYILIMLLYPTPSNMLMYKRKQKDTEYTIHWICEYPLLSTTILQETPLSDLQYC